MAERDVVGDWLGRVRHDLVKHALWRARDLRETGAAATAEDVAALRRGVLEMVDAVGRAATASQVWRALRREFEEEAGGSGAALDAFERAVVEAEEAARATGDPAGLERAIEAVLAIDPAFVQLSHALKSR